MGMRALGGHCKHRPTSDGKATHPPREFSTYLKMCLAMREFLIAGFCVVAYNYAEALKYYFEYCVNPNA
jgi:hypothetical protein